MSLYRFYGLSLGWPVRFRSWVVFMIAASLSLIATLAGGAIALYLVRLEYRP